MPQLMIKGVKRERMPLLVKDTRARLAEIIGCPEDWLTYEWQPSVFFGSEGEEPFIPVIQVWWFDRARQTRDRVAGYLDGYLREKGFPGTQISFHLFREEAYYEDGEHF